MKTSWVVFVLSMSLITGPIKAQTTKYAFSDIPKELLKDANSVKREEQIHMIVKDPQTATVSYHRVYTVLNSDGEDELNFQKYSSTFNYLTDAKITVYNSDGKLIQTYNKKDMSNTSFGEGLVEDGKFTYFKVTAPSYPITIEFDFNVKYKGILRYPNYYIQNEDQAVQQSSFQMEVPSSIGFRFRDLNAAYKPDKKTNGDHDIYTWSVHNLKAKAIESHSGPNYQYLPQIIFAANKFNMDGFAGNMTTWQGFGEWISSLKDGDNTLKAPQIAFYQGLVKDAGSNEEKARILYQYLQNNMRYVSIQLGIGGWRPFPASFVSDKKYGDCKALSHFMQAALAAVGIQSFPALINYGDADEPITNDFPMNSFNHEILCIPSGIGKDTVWLECTSNTANFGHLSYQTADHYAVLLTPEGGKLVKTPPTTDNDNIIASHHTIQIDKSGKARITSHIAGTGFFKQFFIDALYQVQARVKNDFITKSLGFKQTDSITVTEGNMGQTPYPIDIQLSYDQFPDFTSGNKLFVSSRPLSLFFEDVDEDTARTQDYYFAFPYQIRDTTIFELNAALKPESLPENKKLELPYGSYESNYKYDSDNHTVTVISRFCIQQTKVEADKYQELYKFAHLAGDDLGEKIVLQSAD